MTLLRRRRNPTREAEARAVAVVEVHAPADAEDFGDVEALLRFDRGAISPELVLVSPELAEFARMFLPEPGTVYWGTYGYSSLEERPAAQATAALPASPQPPAPAVVAPGPVLPASADVAPPAPVPTEALELWPRLRLVVIFVLVVGALVLYPELHLFGTPDRPELRSPPASQPQAPPVPTASAPTPTAPATAAPTVPKTATSAPQPRPEGNLQPVRLGWPPKRGATYYNVQVFRSGRKVFEAWPGPAQIVLPPRWTHGRRHYRLTPGRYEVFVWPGFGRRKPARYGALLERRRFWVPPP